MRLSYAGVRDRVRTSINHAVDTHNAQVARHRLGSVSLSVKHNDGRGTVTVHSGTGLIAADSNGSSDPYVRLTSGQRTLQTKFIARTLYPKWN